MTEEFEQFVLGRIAQHAHQRRIGRHELAVAGSIAAVKGCCAVKQVRLAIGAPLAKPGHAVPKERLFELVFPGESDVQYEAIEVVVYRLRKKLAHTGVKLVTLRGLGYLLKAGE